MALKEEVLVGKSFNTGFTDICCIILSVNLTGIDILHSECQNYRFEDDITFYMCTLSPFFTRLSVPSIDA